MMDLIFMKKFLLKKSKKKKELLFIGMGWEMS
jgi:hypothetical protein